MPKPAPSTARALFDRNSAAVALFDAGHHKDAAAMFATTLRDCEAVLGKGHHGTLTVAGNLGVARVAAGKRRVGIALIRDNVGERVREFGAEDPRTLVAREALAVSYRLAGDVDDAVELATQVSEQRWRTLGPAHPDTLTSRMGMAQAHAAAGDVEAARVLLGAAIQDAEQYLTAGHPHRTALLQCAESIGMARS